MKTYTDRANAPLIFHNINRYVRLPISIFGQAYVIFELIRAFTWQWFDYVDLSMSVLFLFLFTTAFIGCMKWKPSAWYALMAISILGIAYRFYYLAFYGTYLEGPDLVKPFVQIIWDVCLIIYYRKRKPLFVLTEQPKEGEFQNVHSSHSVNSVNSKINGQLNLLNENKQASSTMESDVQKPDFEDTLPFKLFKRIQFMAEGFCDNTAIFPYGATLRDKETAYIYVYFLFSNANVKNNYFDKQVFTDALSYINYTFKEIYSYTDEMLEAMHSLQYEKLSSFLSLHAKYIEDPNISEPNLWEYTEKIITQFSNATFENTSLANSAFAEFFYTVLEDIQIFNDKHSIATVTATPNLNSEGIPSLTSAKTIKEPQKDFGEEKMKYFIIIIALVGSLIGNMYQAGVNQSLSEDISTLEKDYNEAVEYKNQYKSSLYDSKESFSEIIEEYNFYHNYATIVTENDSHYHAYGCDYINDDSFWIYNVDAAISEGYEPCSYCNPPQP